MKRLRGEVKPVGKLAQELKRIKARERQRTPRVEATRAPDGKILPGSKRLIGAGRARGTPNSPNSRVKKAKRRTDRARAAKREWLSNCSIIDAIKSPKGFRALFTDLRTWSRWIVFLKAIYGLTLSKGELEIFQHHTGRTKPKPKGYQEAIAIVGRQSGKSRIASIIAMYESLTAKPDLVQGERYALLIAQDHRNALRTLFSYVTSPFENLKVLQRFVFRQKAESLELDNGIVLSAYPCKPAAPRGTRAVVAVLDELAFFLSSEGYPRDTEMLRTVRFCTATTNGKVVALSSPYAQSGAVFDLHRDNWGQDESDTLVWTGSSPEMNPTLAANYLSRMEKADPIAYASEVLGLFRSGVSTLFEPARLDECVRDFPLVPDGVEDEVKRYAFVDPSGGRKDAATLAIAYREGNRVIVQSCGAWKSPHNPENVVKEQSAILKSYGIHSVQGDKYAGEWPRKAFQKNGVHYQVAKLDKSQLYLNMLVAVNSDRVELPNDKELLRELRGLQRKTGTVRDKVDHMVGAHDDRSNAVAGVIEMAGSFPSSFTIPDDPPAEPQVRENEYVPQFPMGMPEIFDMFGTEPRELDDSGADSEGYVDGWHPGA